ncbi:dTDP-4-dehydrorhamnose 3,5-epimerase [Sedimentisphaera salicampi]|uniref:dTDP-4-dehydrorhamnose 3,5-epimerase n=1 Tax=Sedimentisphaera salicampi TaxID=1941349 RepID=A0A1W6LKJ2_9BACT|nr:dTDP-4-dehydrorhamnose 3,5-epimerase [Sedimentisphaera salicampi]ARN56297.1 dTDP-4-dehydrorhamnose 3,5-epimerase [Sedimentisphaera salicampi]
MPFEFKKMEIPDVILVTPRVFEDDRGYFMETYKASEFKANGIEEDFVQDNQSFSKRNVIRGLHFQKKPHAQGKLVRCLQGSIWDVAVDLRENSATYKKWAAAELTSDNKQMLYIPPGFAHGFATLSDTAIISYKCTAEYCKDADSGIRWNDPEISIAWPVEEPILSQKDFDANKG